MELDWTKIAICGVFAVSFICAAVVKGFAQSQNCAPREVVIQRLAEKYGETRRSIGIAQQGAVMETFASDDTGTWTMTVTTPGGVTCMAVSGQSFEALAGEPQGDDA